MRGRREERRLSRCQTLALGRREARWRWNARRTIRPCLYDCECTDHFDYNFGAQSVRMSSSVGVQCAATCIRIILVHTCTVYSVFEYVRTSTCTIRISLSSNVVTTHAGVLTDQRWRRTKVKSKWRECSITPKEESSWYNEWLSRLSCRKRTRKRLMACEPES